MKVYAPNSSYSGTVAGVTFDDGVAEVDKDTSPSTLDYFRRHGYGLGKKPAEPDTPDIPDPRYVTNQRAGAPLRDAAVDPQPEDFLPPINAGKANPHGPEVVAPHIHGAPDRRITPGDVAVDDAEAQEAKETAHTAATVQGDGTPERPAGNASTEVWAAYAAAIGVSFPEDAGRDDIRKAIDDAEAQEGGS